MDTKKTVAVFCGSTPGKKEIYKEKAEALASAMYRHGVNLVYGGGNRGLMGILAHCVFENGGTVTGVLPRAMNSESVTAGTAATKTIIVENMHERKKMMYDLSSAFIAMPGGIGTFEELCEIYTWRQLGYTKANIALYNIDGYFDPLLEMFDRAVSEGFLNAAVRDALIVSDDPDIILNRLFSENKELPDKL